MESGPERARAIVRRVWSETPKLTGVVLEVAAEIAQRYEHPGQFIVLYPPGGEGRVYVVIASKPKEARAFELLLGDKAVQKLKPAEGLELEIEPPAGEGFPMEPARGKDVLLFATGSALAALRPVIEVIRAERGAFGRVTLYAGAHTDADFPYAAEYPLWARDRIDIIRSVSKPWVQAKFEEHPLPVENSVAFVVGANAMMDDVTASLVRAGIPLDRIRRNW